MLCPYTEISKVIWLGIGIQMIQTIKIRSTIQLSLSIHVRLYIIIILYIFKTLIYMYIYIYKYHFMDSFTNQDKFNYTEDRVYKG